MLSRIADQLEVEVVMILVNLTLTSRSAWN